MEENRKTRTPSIGVGKGCVLKKVITDKNVRIGDGTHIVNQKKLENFESEMYSIVDGIVIIPKNGVIPPGTII